ncbi:ROK family transcriptional regulator [Aquabacterium sp. OR-4]|uniref:ROK family transcriptional regulator n=1 Tax=Aquabacterium sp. OR-4 TaxID=2978127 RepID=UPI0021B21182|nr:ROK family transcriptional regulator [Aquabacterium sp. OR-4]MDT7838351.1 ROK family transcriptional regulator [Aquabacterium sp. OR-4]
MATEATGNQQLLKVINRMALVRLLCAQPGLSRADLATAAGLTKSTVSGLTRELIAEGWLEEREVVATGDLGRRPTPLFVDRSRLLLLGAEVGIGSLRVVATTLTGEVVARVGTGFDLQRGAPACIAGLTTAMLKVRRQLAAGQQVIGIGVGLPGGVDESSGTLTFAPNLGWRDVAIGGLLRARLQGSALAEVPLFVQNEADVAALGELEFQPAPAPDPLLYVSINQGVGAGVVVGDRLLTGRHGFAGEVGHMVLQVNGPRCSCGRRGCAEALIGTRALVPESSPDDATGSTTLAEVQRRLQAQDPATLRSVRWAGTYLGVLLQNLASAYDPGCIVLGGAVVELGEPFLQPALDTLNDYAAAANLAPPVVQTARFGADAVAVGAAALARYKLTRPLIPTTSSGKALAEGDGALP